jgi:hypothetical protein
MQKVVGSNPISRFRKACDAGLFRWTSRVVRLRRVGLIPDSRARRASGGFKKAPACRQFWSVRTEERLQAAQNVKPSACCDR